jgi:hypothetical protein
MGSRIASSTDGSTFVGPGPQRRRTGGDSSGAGWVLGLMAGEATSKDVAVRVSRADTVLRMGLPLMGVRNP